jgi:hypothetical protein
VAGVTVRLTSLRPLDKVLGYGREVGDSPGLAVTVAVTNGTAEPIDLESTAEVELFWGPEATPASIVLTDAHTHPWSPVTVAPGETGEATYVYTGMDSIAAGTEVVVRVRVGGTPSVVLRGIVGS